MRAMILAAGLGQRMRPITSRRAKPSIPLLNRPLILRTLDYLQRQGVTEAVINLHHHPESITALVGDRHGLGLQVHYSEEQRILGTSGGLKKAEARFRDAGTFVMINSDFFIDGCLDDALRQHRESGALASMILVPADERSAYGAVEMAPDGLITRISGRPATTRSTGGKTFTFTGIHIVEPELLDRIPPGVASGINKDVYPPLIGAGRAIRGYVHPGRWLEFGTPQLYLDGSLALLRDGADPLITPLRQEAGVYLDRVELPDDLERQGPLLVGHGASIGSGSSFRGGVIIGAHGSVGPKTKLESTIVMEGARIGRGVRLKSCLVDSGVEIPDGAVLTRRILVADRGECAEGRRLESIGTGWMVEF